ncbi:hypothetical protein K505DRAFT_375005 [Melanomma pulvis-pyrius CBS 109.77]|uniref:Jacalin-type lectin domain-containing protein n=1 Tax=Melanomma pulvis-pyrius CBS 109.77 TaxID=1314802 RepID=A0A6A6XCK7_9PLEO|nr:hypothetical protein K505DRAFT_375005 [Melanomma pulvis-pyrius CBS 109.77]
MSSPTVPAFSGPITAVEINEWFLKCEKAFKSWDLQHSKTEDKVSTQNKVNIAGNAISSSGDTHDLADWWDDEGDNITIWEDFKDKLKEKALGAYWRDFALQAYYTTKQESPGKDGAIAYIRKLHECRSVINHDSKLKKIDDMAYQCHMLFHALPAVTSKLMEDDFDVVNATESQVETKVIHVSELKKDTSIPVPPTPPTPPAPPAPATPPTTAGYFLPPQWGLVTGTLFTHFGNAALTDNSRAMSPVRNITIKGNGKSGFYMIEDYQLGLASGAILSGPALSPQNATSSYNLAAGEYITGVFISGRQHTYYNSNWSSGTSPYVSLSYMEIHTSTGTNPKIKLGEAGTSTSQFTAPSGWKIVGFRGARTVYSDQNAPDSSYYRYPMIAFGTIMAPV